MNVLTALLLTSALAAGDPAPSDGAKSARQDGAAAKAKAPAAAKAKKPGGAGSLDEDLFGELTGELFEGLDKPKLGKQPAPGKVPSKSDGDAKKQPAKAVPDKPAPKQDLPAEEFGPGEDLGQESNPLLDLGQRMRRAQSLISQGSTGDPTQRLQGDIVKDLDKLIKIASQT